MISGISDNTEALRALEIKLDELVLAFQGFIDEINGKKAEQSEFEGVKNKLLELEAVFSAFKNELESGVVAVNGLDERINEAIKLLKIELKAKLDEAKLALENTLLDEGEARALIQAKLDEIVLEQGLQGIQGEKGEKGEKGEQGLQGEKGEKGEPGEQGIQGEKGEKGEKGEQGERGADGINGQDGRDGADGANGKSAYELWLEKSENAGKSEEDFFNALTTIQEVTHINHINASIAGGVAGVRTNAQPPAENIGLPLGYVWVDESVYPYSFYVLKNQSPISWELVDLNYPKMLKSFDLVLNRKEVATTYSAVCISNIIVVTEDGAELRAINTNSLLSYEGLGRITPASPNLKSYGAQSATAPTSTYSLFKALTGNGAFLSAATATNTDYVTSFTFAKAVRIKGIKLNPFGNVSTRDWCPSTKIVFKDESGNVFAEKLFEFATNAEANTKGFISCDMFGNEL